MARPIGCSAGMDEKIYLETADRAHEDCNGKYYMFNSVSIYLKLFLQEFDDAAEC